jgi:hypothetical protein
MSLKHKQVLCGKLSEERGSRDKQKQRYTFSYAQCGELSEGVDKDQEI